MGRPKKTESKKGKRAASAEGEKRQRRKKDPNAPKRALSGFMFFSNEQRPIVAKEMPELAFLQIASEIGKRWAATSDKKKKKYQAMADKDKERYAREMENYVPDPAYLASQGKKGSRKKKDPNAPKRPMSAYFLYCQSARADLREEYPDKKITEIAQMLAAQWRELSAKKREKFEKQAKIDKGKYEEKMEAYKAGLQVAQEEEEDYDEEEEEEEEEDDDDDE